MLISIMTYGWISLAEKNALINSKNWKIQKKKMCVEKLTRFDFVLEWGTDFHFQLIKNSVYIFQTKCPISHCKKQTE